MFWGLIMEPQRRYTQKVKKSFHISMASLDVSTSTDEPAQVMCGFEGRNYLLCTLRKPDLLQCALDLNFEVGDELSLAANGKCHVHLTGYLTEDFNDEDDEDVVEEGDVEEEEEVEADEKPKTKNKKRNKKEVQNGPPSKKTKVTNSDDDDEDSDLDVRALLGNSLVETDEDDATFSSDDEAEEEDDDDDDDESEVLEEEEEASSLSEGDSEEEQVKEETKPKSKKNKLNGLPKKQEKQEQASPKQKEKEKNKKKEQSEVKSPQKEVSSPKKKALQGGVLIEEIREGHGPPAKPGKYISVYYEGRLKQNNKVFDSTNKGNGFSFRLGSGEVIKGWDVGVAGMKVGGKRRITCPPAMAYGAKGSPPTIPGNSILVFEVELKKVR